MFKCVYWRSLTQKNLRNKTKFIALASLKPEREGRVQVHVTLTYQVTLECYSMDLYSFDSDKQNYIQNERKIIHLPYPGPAIGSVM